MCERKVRSLPIARHEINAELPYGSEEVYHQVLRSTTAPPDNENGVGGSRDRVVKRTCLLQETSLAAETYSHIAWQKVRFPSCSDRTG